jgi:glyoxylase-like metal-dependent hydrolase (beta-lactamase superfamily II)
MAVSSSSPPDQNYPKPSPAFGQGCPLSSLTVSRDHRLSIGNLEIAIISDGLLPIGPPENVFAGRDSAILNDLRSNSHDMVVEQNVLALKSNAGWVVFETGVSSMQPVGPAGLLPANLARAGISADVVEDIVPTHAHLDHVGGIMTDDGKRNYPNARIHLQESELSFWLDDRRIGQRGERSGLMARKNLVPNLDRIIFHRDGSEVLNSVHAIHTPGHTVGHTSFLISSGKHELFVAGDLAHHVTQVAHPDLGTQFDTEPDLAVSTRAKILDFLASRQILCMFYHFAWPGLGYVERHRGTFRFVPMASDTKSKESLPSY